MSLLDIGLLVQEFYAIEAVYAMIFATQYSHLEPMRHSHYRWYQDFIGFRNEFITKFAAAIYDYTVLVVAAELRHCSAKASHCISGYYHSSLFRDVVYRDCTVYKAGDILAAGIKMFDTLQVQWERSYGGEKWKQIAKAGLMKEKVSDCVFIDHCVDLSHNNSVYFDKNAGIFFLSSKSDYESFLNMKRSCDPQALIEEGKGYLFNRLIWRAGNLNILEARNMGGLFSSDYDDTESLLFRYHPVQWGSKRLDCSEQNLVEQDDFCAEMNREKEYKERREYKQCAA